MVEKKVDVWVFVCIFHSHSFSDALFFYHFISFSLSHIIHLYNVLLTFLRIPMFSSLLPAPKYATYDSSTKISLKTEQKSKSTLPRLVGNVVTSKTITNIQPTSNAILNVQVNSDGSLNYSSTIALASSLSSRRVQASYEDTIPLKVKYPNLKHHFPRYDLETCPDDSLVNCLNETRAVIDKLIDQKNGIDPEAKSKANETSFVKYTPNSLTDDSKERVIQIKNYQEDPMLPPKFKLRKNRHREPSPPPPILKNTSSTDNKLTKEDREKWNIPAAISNWKNNQGFTISLDKRMLAANGGSETTAPINLEKFGKLSDALEKADKEAREDIKIRNEILRERALKEQQEKEIKLKELAEISRLGRSSTRKRSGNDHSEHNKRRSYGNV